MTLSLVIPLRVEPGQRRDLRRLRRLLRVVPSGIDVLVVDDTAQGRRAAAVRALVARRPGARLVRSAGTAGEPFSIGRMRDIGAEAARDGAVMFHDVDFLGTARTYLRLAERAPAVLGAVGFFCVPVAFLTPLGSVACRAGPGAVRRRILGRDPGGSDILVDRLVLGSSAIVASRCDLLAVGGHDPAYVGHGAEDFDLMDRLLRRSAGRPQAPDYAHDHGSRGAHLGGFRAVFARHGLPALAERLLLMHLWHPPRRSDARYYEARARNFERLRERLNR